MPFCSNCGTQVNTADKFCNNCGNSLQPTAPVRQQAPPPPPPPPVQQAPQPTYQPPQPVGEQITGFIEQCKYGFPANTFTLFLTAQRIIVVKTGGLGANLKSGIAAQGGLVGGIIGAGMNAKSLSGMSKKTAEYYAMPPDQMLAVDKKNFQIYLQSVQSVEMKPPGFVGQGEIKIKAAGKDHRFMMDVSKEVFQTYVASINQALPGRVFVK